MEKNKKNQNSLIVGGIILVIVVLVVILFMTMGNNKEEVSNNNNQNNNSENNNDNNNNENNNETGNNENNNNSNNTSNNIRNVTIGDLSFSISKEFKNSGKNSEVYQMYNYMTDTDFCMITINKKEVNSGITPKNYFKSYMNLSDDNLNDIKTEKTNNITWNKVIINGYAENADYYYVYINKDIAYDMHFMIYSGKDKCDKFFNDIKSTLKLK